MKRSSLWLMGGAATAVCLMNTQLASAHPDQWMGAAGGWAAGAVHPLMGVDHLMAMIASGLLAVRVGSRKALWIIPSSFVGLMSLGGFLAWLGMPLPHVEWGISLSVIVLGLVVAAAPSIPLWVGAGLVGLFALFHGHAHVAEMAGHPVLAYMTGMLLTTALLHVAAIALGLFAGSGRRSWMVRAAGGAIAASFGMMLVFGLV